MKLIVHVLLLLIALAPGCLLAKPLRVGVSFAIPPYVIEGEKRGIELDLLTQAFTGTQYQLQFEFLPLERTFRMFKSGKLDAIINVRPGMMDSRFLTQPVITFHNRVFTLYDHPVTTLDELRHLRVTSFQRAKVILGEHFATMVSQNPRYEEVAKQQGQVHQLLRGRVDAIVLEERVFYYYLDQLITHPHSGERYQRAQINQADLFPPTIYHFAFRSPDTRELFDRQLAAMKQDGRYLKVFETYGATP
ncbi:substrate-binding periplasmic protein [Aeromonas enteropelogenes]|uniref:substrate-binding periplasmic protein n=1 Tax=Aeromonas TaxID=642 RepID=UPI0005AAE108|nr:transporter substrate-binding domain-containing protein [Aeromonas enteropelogenes]UBH53864.1 transporter substrate-binding domain-containing protein [Aeromonas enteropelogenes]